MTADDLPLARTFESSESSAVRSVRYHPEQEMLDIRYVGGDLYSYFGVPAEVYRALLDAESTGQFVNVAIKPNYRCALEPGRRRFRPD